MDRIIKFRGKCAGAWRFGSLITYADASVIKVWNGALSFEYTVDPETVGQFTGFNDANGKEIYEADVVQYTQEDRFRYILTWNDELMVYRGECIDNGCDVQFTKSFLEKCHIVGNIFDNPELLEGGVDDD